MAHDLLIDQASLEGLCQVTEAVKKLAVSSEADARGAIYTKREVVDFILDLSGYTPDKPLHKKRLLEPSSGGGEFLMAVVQRLLAAYDSHGRQGDLAPCIRAVELHKTTFDAARSRLDALLVENQIGEAERSRLLSMWLISGDFLLQPIPERFDFVVGNPPYVRQEMIPSALIAQYRRLYHTLYDRADLYVPFIQRSLSLLAEGGQLAFICANRWTKNKYGGPLRAMVAESFHVRAYVDMVDTPAFDAEVVAYPAITLIEKARASSTMMASRPAIDPDSLSRLAQALRSGQPNAELGVSLIETVGDGGSPWILGASDTRTLLRRLEASLPTLEETGCKVGIGVATGADKAFIGPLEELDVESSRKLPLVTTRDIHSGTVKWLGLGVINPFEDDGQLVDLLRYPRLRAYLERHRGLIAGRHVAQKAPSNWYRTIDRITPSLANREKLLIPDIKGSAHVVFEGGALYPHHNLYYVTSTEWDLRALQAVLLSSVARQFVAAYSTTMRGGFIRFQAQYLRRIRIPRWAEVAPAMRSRLADAALALDLVECDNAACELYGLSDDEATTLLKR
jgi:Eco57I restriction-modification methylase/TaqI-like C-terminal specificity domain